MPAREAALGVVRRLAEGLGDTTGARVGFRPTLKPGPIVGQWFVSVGHSTYQANSKTLSDGIDTVHTLSIAVTVRLNASPFDRHDAVLLQDFDRPNGEPGFASEGRPAVVDKPDVMPGVMALGQRCHELLLQDFETLKACNRYLMQDKSGEERAEVLNGEWDWGFVEPFHFGSLGRIQPVAADWVGAVQRDVGDTGLYALTLTVTGLRCVRPSWYWRGLGR
jgi:hypothetical protein